MTRAGITEEVLKSKYSNPEMGLPLQKKQQTLFLYDMPHLNKPHRRPAGNGFGNVICKLPVPAMKSRE